MSLTTKIRTISGLARAGVVPGSIARLVLQKMLHVPSGPIRLKNGISIDAPPQEPLMEIFKEIWLADNYGENGLDPSKPGVIIDIGAHVGVFALWAVTHNPKASVYCMEPSPHLCGFLKRNISENGFSNIAFLQAACGGSTREATLHVADLQWGNSLYGGDQQQHDESRLIKTDVLTLSGVFDHFGISTCDLLKIDCEGAEYEILLNADHETLARVRSIALEYHLDIGGGKLPEIEQHLRANGFSVKSTSRASTRGYLYARNTAGSQVP